MHVSQIFVCREIFKIAQNFENGHEKSAIFSTLKAIFVRNNYSILHIKLHMDRGFFYLWKYYKTILLNILVQEIFKKICKMQPRHDFPPQIPWWYPWCTSPSSGNQSAAIGKLRGLLHFFRLEIWILSSKMISSTLPTEFNLQFFLIY